MIIAAAQTRPHHLDVEANINDHIRLANKAADKHAELILFPEMSLTGYEREEGENLAFTSNDERLNPLQELSNYREITIVAGAPIKEEECLYIGMLIIQPNKDVLIYAKQHLHGKENLYYQSSAHYNPIVELNDERISFAICADINHVEHAENACERDATLYLAGIFDTPNDIEKAHATLSSYANRFSFKILMANYGGPSYEWEAGGQSAYWNNRGELVTKLAPMGEDLLVVNTDLAN